MKIRLRAVWAVFRRNFTAYFSSPSGYVFITIFVIATAFVAFNSRTFFANNLADLSALNIVFVWLPVVFIPAITMGVWAEERKLGTSELLLTLPLRDIEVVLGKYFAALGIYTVALICALSNALVLAYLGNPDWGLLLANYIGYWFVGVAFVALGMVASALTSNATVAFILGTVFCLATVFGEDLAGLLWGASSSVARGIGVQAHFEGFILGVTSLPDVLYFLLIAAVMLYINMVLIGRRHWTGGRHRWGLGTHFIVRCAAIGVAAVCISILAGRWLDPVRADTTSESINSISPDTVSLLKNLPGDRPVYIQAYVSPDVPDEYVNARQSLLRALRQFSAIGGSRVLVAVHETPLYSDEAREADERFGITPRRVAEVTEGRQGSREIFLGLAVTCGPNQEVIPFLDPGLSVEYELVRSVRVVTQAARTKVGILTTDLKIMGGFDFQTMNQQPSWSIVSELRKQYDVVEADPGQPIAPDIDVLVVPMPSSLTQEQMDSLGEYLTAGRPALLLVDPLPVVQPMLSPTLPKRGSSPYQQPAGEKGDIRALLARIGVSWDPELIVWDNYNPLTKLRELPPEFVFVSRKAGGGEPFNDKDALAKDLQLALLMFPGALRKLPGNTLNMETLLTTGSDSGELRFQQALRVGFMGMGMSLNENRPHVRTGEEYALAVRVTGELPAAAPEETADTDAAAAKPRPRKANVIVIADVDMMSEQFFAMRRQGVPGLNFDNVTFLLNCVDSLHGDNGLIALRSRRPRYRTLTTIEKERDRFQQEMSTQEQAAEKKAADALDQAQARFDKEVADLRARKDLDATTKQSMLAQLQNVANRRLEAQKAEIEATKQKSVEKARREMYDKVRHIENSVRLWAVVLPPLPVVLIGVCVGLWELLREKRNQPLSRSMRKKT